MKKILTDILIVGSGGSGLRTAIELFKKGKKNILVVGDCKFRDAHTKMAEGGVNAAFGNMDFEPDTPLIHALDTFLEGQSLADPYIVETLAKNAPEAIKDLVQMGADFHREKNGKMSQRYFGAHTYRRTIFKGDTTGAEIMRVLCDAFEKYRIPHIDGLYIIDILKDKGMVTGAVGIKNNELIIIESPVVVLATAGYANIYKRSSSRPTEGYGDGISMALRAGAKVGDMEMVQFHPTGLIFPEEVAGELVTEAVRGEGGILTNKLGERYMKKYSPEKMELSTRDVVARASYMEIVAGRGTKRGAVYLDVSKRRKKDILERLPKMYKMLQKYNNIDISKEAMEVAPTAHYTMGGIKVNKRTGETDVKGLYAVGECTVGVHGANRLGGNSLAEILVFGKLLGKHLARIKPSRKEIDSKILVKLENELTKTIFRNGSLDTKSTTNHLRNIIWEAAGIVRNEKRMKKGLQDLKGLKKEISKIGFKNYKSKYESTVNKMRAMSVLVLGELVIKGALKRRESRGAHYREDYKDKTKYYEKNFFFQKIHDKIILTSKSVAKPSNQMQQGLKNFEKTHNYGHVE